MAEKGLARRDYFPHKHADPCAWGTVMALYVFRKRKWLKIGEFCETCGAIAIFPEYQNGLP